MVLHILAGKKKNKNHRIPDTTAFVRGPLSRAPFMGEEKPDEELMGKRKLSAVVYDIR